MFTETPGGELNWASSYNISMEAVPGTPTSGWNPGTVDALHVRGAVDEDGRAYIPHNVAADTASTQDGMALLVVSRDAGDSLISITLAKTSTELGFGNGFSAMLAVAVPILHPDYNGAVISHTDRVVSGGDPDNDGMFVIGTSLVSYATASPSSAALALREIRTIALVNGKMYRLNDGLAATVIKVEGGLTDALYEEDTMYVQAATGNGHIYMTDGLSYFDYNPKDNEVYTLPSTSFGEIPKRARLIEFWRNRLVLARSDNVPGTWHMSRSGDVHDWDQYPQTDDSAKAVSGTTSPPGLCPDTINAIVPYSNDLLWFGCDSSIWQMTGDPSVGEFDMITDEIGMSWGRPFCKDDMGALWFFGSKGGLYTWDGGLRDVASGRIRRRLRDIDLSSNYIQLVYNYADDGIHIFVIPFGDPIASPRDHYFYDKRSQSFHIDQFGSTTAKIQPTAGIVIDGDAGADRAILLGGGDGRVRRWGSGVAGIIPKSDINTPTENAAIDSYVLIGPIADVDDMSEAAMSELAMVLAPNFSGVHIEIFVTDTPDSLGEPAWRGEIHAGRNANQLVRVSGDSIYIRLRNSTVDEHWALEKATAILSYGGQIRSRT